MNWWSRNWKWFVPTGCLALVVGFVLLFGMIFAMARTIMTSNGAYEEAMKLATANSQVAEAVGQPLEVGWLVSGSTNVSGPSGNASLSIPIEGPNGSGTLYVIAEKKAGKWIFELAEMEIDGREERIDLLAVD